MKRTKSMILAVIISLLILPHVAWAEESPYTIIIKDHYFVPETLEVPAGEKVRLVILNQDPSAEEFESYELNREKIIKGNSKGIIFIGPLKAGTYPYFGEFNPDTAQGKIIAVEKDVE